MLNIYIIIKRQVKKCLRRPEKIYTLQGMCASIFESFIFHEASMATFC